MKTLVIGLDGGTFSLLEPFTEKGYMPNLLYLLKRGTKATLRSTCPAITAPAWVSFMTGLHPDKHGVFDFIDHSREGALKGVISSSHIKALPLWKLVGDFDKKVIIMNVPITYPPYPVNGVMLTGMLTPSLNNVFTYPSDLGPSLLKKLGNYYINVPWRKYRPSEALKFVHDITECTKARTTYLCHLMKHFDWDLAVGIFTEVDSLQHALWCYLDGSDNRDILGVSAQLDIDKKVVEYFRYLDACIGQVLEGIKERYRLFIVSDHGFGPLKKRIHINMWLRQKGLLSYKTGRLSLERALTLTKRLVKPMDIWDWRTRFRQRLGAVQYRDNVRDTIDWPNTKAFSAFRTEQGIYINLEGRQSYGVVKPSEFDSVREHIIGELKKLRDPIENEIQIEAFRREDIYQGPFSHFAPDILINAYDDGGYPVDDLYHTKIFEPATWDSGTGTHRTKGIFVAYGADIRENASIEEASIIDVAPSIMYAQELPVPIHMDGKVLVNIFKKELMEKKPVLFSEYVSEPKGCPDETYSSNDESLVRERLRGLGYLD